jgi:hypothetical protein
MADYGTDISTITPDGAVDLDEYFRVVSGADVVLHAIVKRLVTPYGGLLDEEDYGFDLLGLVNSSTSQRELNSAVAQIEAQCLQDERVSDATVEMSVVDGACQVKILCTLTNDQTFSLVLGVSSVSIDVLEAG